MIANWAGEAVFVLSGFVLPRLINDRMSQADLGIWDLGWSIRSYVDLSCLSFGAAAGYYVSRFRANGRWDDMNRTLGAMLALVIYGALVGALLTLGVVLWAPLLVNTKSIVLIGATRRLLLSMGISACISACHLVFMGVITGSRRFDLLNLVDGLCHAIQVVAIFVCVWFHWGLTIMGLCVLGREVLSGVARYVVAHRVMPQLRVRPAWADMATFREIFSYSAKTIVDVFSKALQYQVGVMFLSGVVGPAAVALYARPRALILISTRFVMGFARVLVPQASALREKQDQKGLGELLIRSTRYGLFLSLPPSLVLLILGHHVLRVWMGSARYADTSVLTILVAGYLPLFAQQATYHVLMGVASHGLAGVASMIGSIVGAVLTFLFVVILRWGINGAALGTAIPVAIVNLLVLPYAGCRIAQVPLSRYVRTCLGTPLLAVLPFAIVLLAGRLWLPFERARDVLLVTMLAATPVLAITYWRVALPDHLKKRLLRGLTARSLAPEVIDDAR